MKKSKQGNYKYIYAAFIVGILLVVGAGVRALNGSSEQTFTGDIANLIINNPVSQAVGEAFGSTAENITNLTALTLSEDLVVNGDTTLVSTSTPSEYTYSTIYIPLTQVATTTAADPAPEGYWCNTGAPVFVNSWILDISTANDLWGGNMTFGTTTCTAATATGSCGDGTESFTATSTATIAESTYVNTSTVDFINAWNINNLFAGAGTYYDSEATGTPFMLNNNDCIVVHNDHSGATSSEGYTTAGGWATYAGHLILNAIIK